MTAGRPPKPTALKLLTGNAGKRPLPENEPAPVVPSRLPPPPKHLSDEAKSEWRRMGRELLRLGLLTTIDRAEFALYCQAWGRWVEAEEALPPAWPGSAHSQQDAGTVAVPLHCESDHGAAAPHGCQLRHEPK